MESETLRQQAANNSKEQFANSPAVQNDMKDVLLNHAGLYETLRGQPDAESAKWRVSIPNIPLTESLAAIAATAAASLAIIP